MVPVDSSMARMPLPGATMAWAVSTSCSKISVMSRSPCTKNEVFENQRSIVAFNTGKFIDHRLPCQPAIKPSADSVADSHDNALTETLNELFKAEAIHRSSWRTPEEVELEIGRASCRERLWTGGVGEVELG